MPNVTRKVPCDNDGPEESQAQAVAVARAVVGALLDPEARLAPGVHMETARDANSPITAELRAADRLKGPA